MSALASPRLRRLIVRASRRFVAESRDERCELCGEAIASEHRHVLDRHTQALLCACRACSLLFDHGAAGGDRYRLVCTHVSALDDFRLDELAWRALRIPVEIAYFVRSGDGGRVTAYYPSPAGAVASSLALDAWDEIERENRAVRELAPDVEALLVNRLGGTSEGWIVGIDTCYRLVAVMRTHWHGLQAGSALWSAIATFFDELRGTAQHPMRRAR